ncbi:MAG: tRNA A-37 threonylcarbamoyl transferase component Bud32 [Haloarculaceae archaeon]|jgi:tRNA A-37 threonylcarbamoyl transferase component Bud32
MSFRRLLRGEVPDTHVEEIAREVTARDDQQVSSIEILDADNWLSTPCVVNEQWFVKIISAQNSLVHALLTTGRNLGVFSSGTEGFFEHFGTPIGMAEHELEATRQMRQLGVNAPAPLEAFEHEGYGVLVFEYLPAFESLNELDAEAVAEVVPDLFDALARMHDAGLVHGDLRGENVLVVDEDLYFIDATKVREDAIDDARAYDIACGLAALEPLVGARVPVVAAVESHGADALLAADSFLDFVNIRPDHDFDAAAVKGEISKVVV